MRVGETGDDCAKIKKGVKYVLVDLEKSPLVCSRGKYFCAKFDDNVIKTLKHETLNK